MPAAIEARTSRSTIRPSGPVPVTVRGSSPDSAASRLARGLIASRAVGAAAGGAWTGGGPARAAPAWRCGHGRRCHGDRRRRLLGDRLAWIADVAADLVDRDDRALLRELLEQDAVDEGLDLHGRLVGLDLEEDIALADRVAHALVPAGEETLLRHLAGLRHADGVDHDRDLGVSAG